MPANTAPIYPIVWDPSTDSGTGMATDITTATGDYTGISANHRLVHTAWANGTIVRYLQFKAKGTNTASVARIYLNNGSIQTTATNNSFFDEVSLPWTTASNTAATQTITYAFPWNGVPLPAGWRVYVWVATTVAAWWVCTCIAWEY